MKPKNPLSEIYSACNSGTNQSKWQLIEDGKLTSPRCIDVELTNACNYRCRFCPTGTNSVKRSKGFMTDETIDCLVENIKECQIPAVRFIRWGEPTIHPKYLEVMRRVKKAGAMVHINTNGSLLTREAVEEMIDMKLDSIKISFQGADEGTYNEVRKGGDYQRLLESVKMLYETRGGVFARSYKYPQPFKAKRKSSLNISRRKYLPIVTITM